MKCEFIVSKFRIDFRYLIYLLDQPTNSKEIPSLRTSLNGDEVADMFHD